MLSILSKNLPPPRFNLNTRSVGAVTTTDLGTHCPPPRRADRPNPKQFIKIDPDPDPDPGRREKCNFKQKDCIFLPCVLLFSTHFFKQLEPRPRPRPHPTRHGVDPARPRPIFLIQPDADPGSGWVDTGSTHFNQKTTFPEVAVYSHFGSSLGL